MLPTESVELICVGILSSHLIIVVAYFVTHPEDDTYTEDIFMVSVVCYLVVALVGGVCIATMATQLGGK